MTFDTDNPVLTLRMKEANRIMRLAMRRNPEEYYEFISRPRLKNLAEVAGLRTATEYAHTYDTESNAVDLFEAGIHDIIPPFSEITEQHPELTKDQLLAIMSNPETIVAYGLLASMGQEGLHRLYDEDGTHFTLSDSETAITLAHPVRSSPYGGCAAANVREKHLKMLPIFEKFVTWSGSLAVISHFEHR